MQNPFIIALSVQGIAFAVWTFLSFRAIFQIRAIAASDTGQVFPGPVSFLQAMGVWLKDPAHRRIRLFWLIALICVVLPAVWLAARTPIVQ